jgi:hypothetical protein
MDKITKLTIDGTTYQLGDTISSSGRYPSPKNQQNATLYTTVSNLELEPSVVFSSSVDGDSEKAARRIPTFTVANDGTYLAACEARTSLSDSSQIDILVAKKAASDESWTYTTIFAYDSSSKYKYMNPSFCVDRNGVNKVGRIYLFCMKFQITTSNSGNWTKLSGSEVDNVYKYSDDNGTTWSDEQSIGASWSSSWKYSTVSYSNSFFMNDGTLVIPCMGMNSSGKQHSGVLYQKRGTTTWTYSCPTPTDGENECTAYENDGKLFVNTRNSTDSRCIYEYDFTNDTFTLFDNSFIPNTACAASVERVTINNVNMYVLSFVDTNADTRQNPTLWISADGIVFQRAILMYNGVVGSNAGYCSCSSYSNYVGYVYEYDSAIYFVDLTSVSDILANTASFMALSDQYNLEITKNDRYAALKYLYQNNGSGSSEKKNSIVSILNLCTESSKNTVMVIQNSAGSSKYTAGSTSTEWTDWKYLYCDISQYAGKQLLCSICNVSKELGIGFTAEDYKTSDNTFLSFAVGTDSYTDSLVLITIPENAKTLYYDKYTGHSAGSLFSYYTFSPQLYILS